MTTSPQFDIDNYSPKRNFIINNDFQLLDVTFESSILLVKWKTLGTFKGAEQSNLIGTFRILRNTPLGELEPLDIQLKVFRKKEYIQFTSIPSNEFGYQIEILNPVGIIRTEVIIQEFIPPINYLNPLQVSQMGTTYGNDPSGDNSALIAAIASGDAAQIAAINALPNNVADAIANNQMFSAVSAPISVGTGFINVIPSDPNRQALEVANRGNSKLKLFISNVAPASGLTFLTANSNTVELIAATGTLGTNGYKPGGTWVANPEQAKSAVYAISDNANGSVVISTTVTAP